MCKINKVSQLTQAFPLFLNHCLQLKVPSFKIWIFLSSLVYKKLSSIIIFLRKMYQVFLSKSLKHVLITLNWFLYLSIMAKSLVTSNFVLVQLLSCVQFFATEKHHTRLLCPSLSPGVCSNSCPLNQKYYLPSRPWPSTSLPALNPS